MKKVLVLLAMAIAVVAAGCGSSNSAQGPNSQFCQTFKQFYKTMQSGETSNPAGMKKTLDSAVSYLDKLQAQAPASVQKDVTTMSTAFKQIAQVFQKAGYNQANVKPEDLQKVNTKDLQPAQQKVLAYGATTCKIPGLTPPSSGPSSGAPSTTAAPTTAAPK